MKHIKYFETSVIEPQINDWVICKETEDGIRKEILNVYLSNNIGRIKYIYNVKYIDNVGIKEYKVEFFGEIPDEIQPWFFNHILLMYREDIVCWSKNKEDLPTLYQATKYNL